MNQSVNQLIGAVVEGVADEAQRRQLTELLQHDPEARRAYLNHAQLQAELLWRYTIADVQSPITLTDQPQARAVAPRRRFIRPLAACAAAAAVITIAALLWYGLPEHADAPNEQPHNPTVATLTNTEHATFDDSSDPMHLGNNLPSGPFQLAAGSAQIMLNSGAMVDLSGPCDIDLTGPNQASLHRGMFTAYVPPRAQGFTVDFPGPGGTYRIVDRGTEFTLNVQSVNGSDLWVHQGSVELITPTTQMTLKAGESVSIRGDEIRRYIEPQTKRGRLVRFDADGIEPYLSAFPQDGHRGTPTAFHVLDNGLTLHLVGNVWKTYKLPYNVTRRTVIEFEFRTDRPGEIHAIGFDTGKMPYGAVQFFGPEQRDNFPHIAYPESVGDWTTVRVPIGEHFRGKFKRLLLVNDDDASAVAESWYRNIRIYEDDSEKPVVHTKKENPS
ncbi:FecR domain-containing protein [Planctomycetales bacterium ZRK34]|nr:FecR domain-containing protein [Planctomycetales bacterium ZRK34]